MCTCTAALNARQLDALDRSIADDRHRGKRWAPLRDRLLVRSQKFFPNCRHWQVLGLMWSSKADYVDAVIMLSHDRRRAPTDRLERPAPILIST